MDDERVRALVGRVRSTLDETVDAAVARTWDQVAAYAASPDPGLRADVRAHVAAVFGTVLTTMEEGRPAGPADFPLTHDQAARRVHQGVGLADFLQAFRVNQVMLWEAILAAATDRRSRDVALGLATQVMEVIEAGSAVAAEAYLAAEHVRLAEGDRVRRDLVEDLLAGRDVPTGPRADVARSLGLEVTAPVLVGSAVAVERDLPGARLRDALTALRTVLGGGQRGLAVIRQDEIVGIVVVPGGADRLIDGLERAQRRLAREGVALALGVSTVHDGLAGVPRAHAEAAAAREALRGAAGTLALPRMATLDYLLLREDPTARRLVRPAVRQFVEDDEARGGALIDTFCAYVACDLNAKEAAVRLHLHVNSAYYRLDRIGERTGLDLRRFADLQELVVGIALLTGRRVAGPAPVPAR